MWIRQCDVDARTEAPPPIPARIASNEEFLPPPQSPRQREYEARLATLGEQVARHMACPAGRSWSPAPAWPRRWRP